MKASLQLLGQTSDLIHAISSEMPDFQLFIESGTWTCPAPNTEVFIVAVGGGERGWGATGQSVSEHAGADTIVGAVLTAKGGNTTAVYGRSPGQQGSVAGYIGGQDYSVPLGGKGGSGVLGFGEGGFGQTSVGGAANQSGAGGFSGEVKTYKGTVSANLAITVGAGGRTNASDALAGTSGAVFIWWKTPKTIAMVSGAGSATGGCLGIPFPTSTFENFGQTTLTPRRMPNPLHTTGWIELGLMNGFLAAGWPNITLHGTNGAQYATVSIPLPGPSDQVGKIRGYWLDAVENALYIAYEYRSVYDTVNGNYGEIVFRLARIDLVNGAVTYVCSAFTKASHNLSNTDGRWLIERATPGSGNFTIFSAGYEFTVGANGPTGNATLVVPESLAGDGTAYFSYRSADGTFLATVQLVPGGSGYDQFWCLHICKGGVSKQLRITDNSITLCALADFWLPWGGDRVVLVSDGLFATGRALDGRTYSRSEIDAYLEAVTVKANFP